MAAAGPVVGINGRSAERARDALSRVVARHMAARGRGRLVFISSMVGPQSFQGDPAYVASKGGLAGYLLEVASRCCSHCS